jgi:tryptophanyl-tRNA synthetase
MRPTGKLHIGHLVGALKNWVALQEQHDCFYFVADWHALTSEFANTAPLTANGLDNVADWIAAGVDPERSTIFVQSMVPGRSSQLARACPDVQRAARADYRQGLVESRVSGLPAAPDGRRCHV